MHKTADTRFFRPDTPRSEAPRPESPRPEARLSALLTIGIVTYNGRSTLPATLASLADMTAAGVHTIVVDDASPDGTADWLEEAYPGVQLVRAARHVGRPNRLRNDILARARTPLVLLVDDDVSFSQECAATLLDTISAAPDVLCVTPRLVFADAPDRVYMDGGGLHYLGLSTSGFRGSTVSEAPAGPPHPTLGGGVMLVNRLLAADLDFFDDGYLFGWGDDGELHLRGRLCGLQCLHVPAAVAGLEPADHGTARAFAQLYNRYRTLLTTYATRSLLLLAPALLAFEAALTVSAALGGFTGARLRALAKVFADWPDILEQRRRVQSRRLVSDAEILSAAPMLWPVAMRGRFWLARLGALLEPAIESYYRFVKRWL